MGLFGNKNPKVLREFNHGTTRLRIIRNELSKEKVGAIVNCTNHTLDHPDGDSKLLIVSGSHQFLFACRR